MWRGLHCALALLACTSLPSLAQSSASAAVTAAGVAPSALPALPEGMVIRSVDLQQEQLALYWRDPQGQLIGSFTRLRSMLAQQGRTLRFAMNAGMFHRDRSAVGLLLIDGRQLFPLNTGTGFGNFYMKPNGVFLIDAKGQARVVRSEAWTEHADGARFATQSGPMLVSDGELNPHFNAESTSRTRRNGVCVQDGRVWLVLADKPINFYDFAQVFRQHLHCRDALYLDGSISAIYPAANQSPQTIEDSFGPLLGVSVPARD